MSKAPYYVIHVNHIDEVMDIDALAERVRIVLTQADGWSLHSIYPDVEEFLNKEGNKIRIITAVTAKLRAKRDAQA
jgi:hypothetical protein